MCDSRISVVPIDSQEGDFTVGLCFLNDLIYLFRQPNFYTYLSQPVIDFIKKVNYFDSEELKQDELEQMYSSSATEEANS